MCEKHIKLFFCVHRREADDTLFVFILTEGSAAFAYDIIQFFRNSMDYIVNLFLRENKHKLVSALIIKGCHKLIVAAVNTVISIDEKFKEKILNKEATRLGKICDHTVKLLFSAFAQTVKIKISFHNLISFHRASRSLRCRAKCLL